MRRRPDVRSAERLAAAQAEKIGIAQADLYPAFSITGSFGYAAQFFPDLFRNTAFNGGIGPSFQWNLLNYGRIVNNVHLQDAKFQELVVTYQDTVLKANQEVEDGLIAFLQSQQRERLLGESVNAAGRAVDLAERKMEAGTIDVNRFAVIAQNKVAQEDTWAQARGDIAQGLILVYRALGGGWEIRLGDEQDERAIPMPDMPPNTPKSEAPKALEMVPTPIPNAPPLPKEPDFPKEPAVPKAAGTSSEPEAPAPIIAKQSELSKEPAGSKGINVLRDPVRLKAPDAANDVVLPKEAAIPQEPATAIQPGPTPLDPKKLIEPEASP